MNLDLVNKLNQGAILLTPTRRLATGCLSEFAKFQSSLKRAWVTPAVYALTDWFHQCWAEFEMSGLTNANLLNVTQSQLCLENIIQASSYGLKLIDTYQTAKRIFTAWKILHDWQSLDILETEYAHIDYQAFSDWIKEYQRFLGEHQAIDEAMLPQNLLNILVARKSENLVFYGFEEKSPFLINFEETLLNKSWKIDWVEANEIHPQSCYRREFNDLAQEQIAAVQFAKEKYDQGIKSIAIIVLDLADQRQTLETLLKSTFDPQYLATPWIEVDPRFNISAAIPLIQYPIVCRALEILREEHFQQKATYSTWSQQFRKQLESKSWPGSEALTSIEYQSMIRFDALLNELSQCDEVLSPCSYFQALSTLEKLASYIPFQPENREATVQVLGMLEAAGQTFDAIWIMGMQNEAWPLAAKHHPYIPVEIQRARKMPHSSAEREMQYALNMTNRFKKSAHEIVFSHFVQSKERRLNVSELIRDIPIYSDMKKRFAGKIENEESPLHLEYLYDQQAPKLSLKEGVYGTARVLELQAACPFRAFSEYRLGIKEKVEANQWLSRAEQGIILHNILEKWVKAYPTQTRLFELSIPERENHFKQLIQDQFAQYRLKKWPEIYQEAEYSRLIITLNNFINFEINREFFKVIQTEYRQTFTLNTFTFHLRCDRIEEDEFGAQWIVDYKTGKYHFTPQLPLYAMAYASPNLRGIRVIQIHSEGAELIEQPIQDEWETELERLSNEFVEGQANIDPKNGDVTCQYCHLKPFCRIREEFQ